MIAKTKLMATTVSFIRGLKASYSASTYAGAIYFATDTHEIIVDNVTYGLTNAVSNVELDAATNKIKVTMNNGSSTMFAIADATASLSGLMSAEDKAKLDAIDETASGSYDSAIEDTNLTMPNAVGGIAKGTKVSDLEGKSYDEIFDNLFFPTVNPTFIAPTATIAWKSYSNVQEVGATGPTETNFTCTYNAGAINLNGSKQADRGGALKDDESFIYVNNTVSNITLPAKVAEGATTFKYRAAYEAGPQPKDNKGNNYGTPLAASTVDSSAITLNGVFPVFASTSASNNPVKQSLSTATTLTLTLASCNSGDVVYKLPSKMTSCKQENPMKPNVFDVEGLTYYSESTNTENINGVEHTYYIYTYNSSSRGSLKEQIKF